MPGFLALLLGVVSLLLGGVRGGTPLAAYSGTTPYIRDIFLGRCWEYQVVKGNAATALGGPQNCTELWELFSQAFAYREACAPTPDDYMPFLQAAEGDIPADSMVLWSGTYALSGTFSAGGERAVTISDTLCGYLVDNLVWCGQPTEPGINYTDCPAYGSCNEDGLDAFWAAASEQFARKASGKVQIVLTSTREYGWDAYHNSSLLHRVEIPNLPVENVTMVTTLLAKNIGQDARETCHNASLLLLKSTVEARGLPYECLDQPEELRHILCVDYPRTEECRFVENVIGLEAGAGASALYTSGMSDVTWLGVAISLVHKLLLSS